MKPYYTKVTTDFDQAVTIRYDEMKVFYPHWHYHDEYELVYIHRSSGIRYVGDAINPYRPGDLVLLGSLLPHIWINKIKHTEAHAKLAAATVLHIQPKFVHNSFFDLPLMHGVKKLFDLSSRGIRFVEFVGAADYLAKISDTQSTERVIALITLLNGLSKHQNIELLSSHEFHRVIRDQRGSRLGKVHNYIASHFRAKIQLNTLSELTHMTPPAFCNYFKRKTGKTVFSYINDLKIGYSCKLLMAGELTISQVAQESGYNSVSFYNRKFKEKMNLTPKEYRKKYTYMGI